MVKGIVNIGKEQLESATAIVYDGRSSPNPVSDADSPADSWMAMGGSSVTSHEWLDWLLELT